jgi:Arc/MetJ-type ribon-helix-helix transcriptional regulator
MTTQVAVRLPDDVVARVDELVASGSFGSRSDAVRAALESLLRTAERRAVDQSFADGFRRHPETPDELADATRLATGAINAEPWERWW